VKAFRVDSVEFTVSNAGAQIRFLQKGGKIIKNRPKIIDF
jgi:hypothetical protein